MPSQSAGALHFAFTTKDFSMISAILLSGGAGKRMQSACPKQYLSLSKKLIILHALESLLTFPLFQEIIIVCEHRYQNLFTKYKKNTPIQFARPGKERQDSVLSGFSALSTSTKWICIHDGARPLLKSEDLRAVIDAGMQYGAATLATPLKTTIKEADSNLFVQRSLDRSKLWDIQTPQVLSYSLMEKGFQKIQKEKLTVTDDVSLAEILQAPVKLIQGSYSNIKITTPEDLYLAKLLLKGLHA